MAMRQILVFVASALFLGVWVFGWGALATGSARAGLRYLRIWLLVMAGLLTVGAIGMLIAWPLMPG